MMRPATPQQAGWDEAGRRVADLRAAHERNKERFAELAADPAYLTLPQAEGRTAARRRIAREAMNAAGSLLTVWDETLTAVERKLAGRPQRSALDEIKRLLDDDAFKLKPTEIPRMERRRPGGKSTEPRFSLAAIRELLEGDLRTVAKLVADVARGREAAEHLAAVLRSLGDDADGVPPRGAVAAIVDLARTDPVAVRMDRVEALEVELTQLRCGQLSVAVDVLEAEENVARDRIAGLGSGARVPHAAVGLRHRLRAVEERCVAERRADLVALDGLAADIAAASRAARHAERPATVRYETPAAVRDPARTCTRPDCPCGGLGELDEDGICECCFRAAERRRREAS